MGEQHHSQHSNPHHHLTLPGFHDFSSFARNSPHAPAQAGPSRPSARHFDNQHFMSQVNAAQHASNSTNGASTNPPHQQHQQQQHQPPMTGDPAFDILDWYPAYQSCQRYFLDHAQHEPGTQALCALINIRLPFQWLEHPIASSSPPSNNSDSRSPSNPAQQQAGNNSSSYQFNFPNPGNLPSPTRSRASSAQPPGLFISLLPYLRRLLVTGFDKPAILHGLFGDDYVRGILPHLDCERRNYLFAAKAGGWKGCKGQYDRGSGGGDEGVPFMKPLEGVEGVELEAAEKAWGRWLCMEDWMLGPNAPQEGDEGGSGRRGEGRGGESAMGGLADGIAQGFEGR